jgi:hypothetical protein
MMATLHGCGEPERSSAPYVELRGTPVRALAGESRELTWMAREASNCTASGAWAGPRPVAGRELLPIELAGTIVLTCSGPGGSTTANLTLDVNEPPSPFPVRVVTGSPALLDRGGKPWRVHGDAAWSLIAKLNDEEIERYLADRRARGFNTLLVNLIEHKFTTRPPRDFYGEPPFLAPGDFARPNERYFARAERIVRRAEENGFLVLLAPAYLGFDGGDEGWYAEMTRTSEETLRRYGRYLGALFRDRRNVVWVLGGDFNPPDRRGTEAVAAGIRDEQPAALWVAHAAPETAGREYWRDARWLSFETVYSYRNVPRAVAGRYRADGQTPIVLLETHYENTPGIDARQIRAQAYSGLLAGAVAGQVYGNHPIWHFGPPGYYDLATTWQRELGSAGAVAMQALWTVLSARDWWKLQPMPGWGLMKDLRWPRGEQPLAALATDGSFALVYLPRGTSTRVDLSRLSGKLVRASWFDPVSGGFRAARRGMLPTEGVAQFHPPERNAGGDLDWLLVLDVASP